MCRLQLIVNCFLIIKVNGANLERGLKIRENSMKLTCMIWFDGLITCIEKWIRFFNTCNIRILSRMVLK